MLRFSILLTVIACSPSLSAADWPAFRGPQGNGLGANEMAPTTWGPDQNVRWKVALPHAGNGSPIVSNGSVFVTSALDPEGKKRSLLCFDRNDGSLRWQRTVEYPGVMPTHRTNPYCGTTPAADGERVVVWHASAGLFCYDFLGALLWKKNLGEFKHIWGYGTSPVIHGEQVILHTGPGERSFLTCLNLADGATVWETEEPQDGNGEKRSDGKYMGSWSTPIVATIDGQPQIICSMSTRVAAFSIGNGSVLWSCNGLSGQRGDLAYSSPVIAGDICVAIGGYRGPGMGFRLGGRGDLTEKNRLWRNRENPQSIGTGIYHKGFLYRPNAGPSTIECLNPKTGEVQWTGRTGNAIWASLVLVGDHCYATNQDGQTIVFKPNPEQFDVVARNSLNEPSNSTPAISEGRSSCEPPSTSTASPNRPGFGCLGVTVELRSTPKQ